MLAPEASAFRSLFAKALGESRTGRGLAHVCVFLPRFRPETRAVRPQVPLVPPTPGCWHRGGPGTGCGGAGGWRRVKSRLCSPAPALLALPRHRRGRAAFARPPPSQGHAEISYTTPPLRCSHAQQNLLPLPLSPPSLPPFFFFSPFSHCSEHGEGSASGPGGDEPGAPEPPGAVGQRGLAAAAGSVKGRMPLSGWEGFQQPAGRAPSLLPSSPLPLKEFEATGGCSAPLALRGWPRGDAQRHQGTVPCQPPAN